MRWSGPLRFVHRPDEGLRAGKKADGLAGEGVCRPSHTTIKGSIEGTCKRRGGKVVLNGTSGAVAPSGGSRAVWRGTLRSER